MAHKHYITLEKPSDINLKRVIREVEKLIEEGAKTFEVGLRLNFVIVDEWAWEIMRKFQTIKNKIAFQRDIKTKVM